MYLTGCFLTAQDQSHSPAETCTLLLSVYCHWWTAGIDVSRSADPSSTSLLLTELLHCTSSLLSLFSSSPRRLYLLVAILPPLPWNHPVSLAPFPTVNDA